MHVICLWFPEAVSDPSSSLLQRVAEACYRWTPDLAISEEAVFLDFSRCAELYREESVFLKIRALCERFGSAPRMATADDAPTALAFAKWGEPFRGRKKFHSRTQPQPQVPDPQAMPKELLPIEALLAYVSPFRNDPEGLKETREMIMTLKKLGLALLVDFMALPPRALPSRFGKLGALMIQRVSGGYHAPWPKFVPSESIRESIELEVSQPLRDLEPMLFPIKGAVDRAMARLRGRGRRATLLQLVFRCERYSSNPQPERRFRLALSLPQGSAVGVLPILREKLSAELQRNPLESPVLGLDFEILETCPGGASQRDFFHRKEEEAEAWNSLISRLTEKLGQNKAFTAQTVHRYLPESGWKRELPLRQLEAASEGEAPGARILPFPLRPLRMLQEPVPLRKQGDVLMIPGRPESAWRILDMDGPELLQGEWWKSGFERNYYRFSTEQGDQLWVYEAIGTHTFYLQGYFD